MFKKSIAALAAMMGMAAPSDSSDNVENRHVEVSNGWRLRRPIWASGSVRVGIKRNRKTTTAAQLKRAATKRRNVAKRGAK